MTKRLGWLVLVGAVAFACGEAGQSMSGGAGAMDGGGGTTNGTGATGGTVNGGGATGGTPEQNVRVECNKSETETGDGYTLVHRWAEFDVDPGQTERTVCTAGDPQSSIPTARRDSCFRGAAQWYEGTSTGFHWCGYSIDYDDPGREDVPYVAPLSITVHR